MATRPRLLRAEAPWVGSPRRQGADSAAPTGGGRGGLAAAAQAPTQRRPPRGRRRRGGGPGGAGRRGPWGLGPRGQGADSAAPTRGGRGGLAAAAVYIVP